MIAVHICKNRYPYRERRLPPRQRAATFDAEEVDKLTHAIERGPNRRRIKAQTERVLAAIKAQLLSRYEIVSAVLYFKMAAGQLPARRGAKGGRAAAAGGAGAEGGGVGGSQPLSVRTESCAGEAARSGGRLPERGSERGTMPGLVPSELMLLWCQGIKVRNKAAAHADGGALSRAVPPTGLVAVDPSFSRLSTVPANYFRCPVCGIVVDSRAQ